eukprot:9911529-Heterocapsa_arctica.AAC.1
MAGLPTAEAILAMMPPACRRTAAWAVSKLPARAASGRARSWRRRPSSSKRVAFAIGNRSAGGGGKAPSVVATSARNASSRSLASS